MRALGTLERLERKNQDYLLLETIKRVGVQNYSLLSRLTGLNAETIRYKVNKHLTRLGLNTTININYGELGLSVSYLIVKPKMASARNWMDSMSYFIYATKLIGANRFFCLVAVPLRFRKKYADLIEDLKTRGIIDDYEMKDLYWVRYPPFRAELYDFSNRTWTVDWDRFEQFMNESGPSYASVNRESAVDYVDLQILKAMLEDPTVPLAKTAKALNANPRTVRYHNSEHVNTGHFILGSNIRWVRPMQEGNPGKLMQIVLLFRRLDEDGIVKVRRYCNNLPFTWFEGGTEDRTYLSLADIPIETFHEAMQRIEFYLGDMGDACELLLLEPSRSNGLGIPDKMFDQERGWRLYNLSESIAGDAGG